MVVFGESTFWGVKVWERQTEACTSVWNMDDGVHKGDSGSTF